MPSFRYILGPPGSGKTYFCQSQIAKRQDEQDGPAIIYIVPEQGSLQAERGLISMTKRGGICRARVLSFNRLAFAVFSQLGGPHENILEDSGKHMLLRRIVSEQAKNLAYYRLAKNKKGFIEALGATITELYQYSILPEDLERIGQGLNKREGLRLKLKDLSTIYSAYRQFLKEHYISSDEALDILANSIDKAPLLKNAEVWIDSFKSFTPQERKVIKALGRTAKEVNIALTIDVDNPELNHIELQDIYFEAKYTMKQINTIAEELEADRPSPIFFKDCQRAKPKDLKFLTDNYNEFLALPFDDVSKNIQIHKADNIIEEITVAAKLVTMLCRDKGYRYSDIAIVCPNLKEYAPYIEYVFVRFDLPVFIDSRRVLRHPLTELVFSALELVAHGFSHERVFRFLRSGFGLMDVDKIDKLEGYVLAYGIKDGQWKQDFVYGGHEHDLEALNAARAELMALLSPLSFKGEEGVEHVSACVYAFLVHNSIPQKLTRLIDEGFKNGDNEQLRLHEQAWSKLMAALDKMVAILGASDTTIDEYAKILEAGIGDVGIAPPSLDQLIIGDLRRSRFGEVKALILLGALEGELPSATKQGGLFNEHERQYLGEFLEIAQGGLEGLYEEEYLLYIQLAKPTEHLAICYHQSAMSGKAYNPSPVIERVLDLFPNISELVPSKLDENSPARISSRNEALEALGHYIRLADDMPAIYSDALLYFKEHEPESIERIEQAITFETAANLSKATLDKLYGGVIHSSASKIERYMSCPFAYFVRYNLLAKERKLYEVGAIDIGNILHNALLYFGEGLKQSPDMGAIAAAELARLSLERAMERDARIFQSSGRYMHLLQKLRKIMEASAMALYAHGEGGFELLYNELSFSPNQDENTANLGPIQIELDNGKMFLEGRIDRVDVLEKEGQKLVKIVDYKSGSKRFDFAALENGIDLQLIIYMGAFIDKLPKDMQAQLLPAAIFYFNLINPLLKYKKKHLKLKPEELRAALQKDLQDQFKMTGLISEQAKNELAAHGKGAVVTQDEFMAFIRKGFDHAKEAGEGILSGHIPIRPRKFKDKTPCDYCEYKTICRIEK